MDGRPGVIPHGWSSGICLACFSAHSGTPNTVGCVG